MFCRKIVSWLVALSFILTGAGAAAAASLRVTLLLEDPDPANPQAADMRRGLELAEKRFGIRARVVAAPPQEDQTTAFREAAAASDLVLVADARLHEVLRDNAANFRKVRFGCIDTGVRAPNIMSVTFADEQAAFLAGAAAALVARAGCLPGGAAGEAVGWLSGESTPMDDSMFSAYVEGARLIFPEMRVIRREAASFTDEAAAAGQADGLMDEGSVVVAVMARRADAAAVKRVAERGGYVIGESARPVLPERTLASIVRRLDLAVFDIVAAAAEGKFAGGRIVTRTLEDGGVEFVSPEVFARRSGITVPPRVFSRLEELRRELASGGIRLQSRRLPTLCDCY
ncbi:BMP family ABC transporter substrate-binding protein [uncultured Desulfovibrio sp.]|uniref:BMP family ABC transporter substrate-binding protein n=1 Tax=uncultured Desulfovibrio sp. TaxID=167968 RepID=UPI002621E022|nr:BMP family ABC transporter substrate-binding protein [uncultured Desulfovibrio sp.]